MTEILKTLLTMTPAWLEEALTEAGHSPPPVKSVQVRPMDGFVGAMGEVGIVSVTYAGSTDLPVEFVAKCPLDDDIARMYASVMLSYQREAGFYTDLASPVADRSGMTLPRCFVNRFDPETHGATLLIERVHPAQKGDILEGTTFERMQTLVGDLARLHGAFWMDESLTSYDWLIDWMSPSLRIGIPFTLDSWANIREHLPQYHPDDIAEMVSDVWLPHIEGWLQRFDQRPWTLIHQDYELDNMLFRSDGPVIVDWQTVMRSFPGLDLGWLLMASHNDETPGPRAGAPGALPARAGCGGRPRLECRGPGRGLGLDRLLLGGRVARAVRALVARRRSGPRPSAIQGDDARHYLRGSAVEHRRAHAGPHLTRRPPNGPSSTDTEEAAPCKD